MNRNHPLSQVTEDDLERFFESPIYKFMNELWEDMHTTWANTLKGIGTPERQVTQAQGAVLILDHDLALEGIVRGEVKQAQIDPEEDLDQI